MHVYDFNGFQWFVRCRSTIWGKHFPLVNICVKTQSLICLPVNTYKPREQKHKWRNILKISLRSLLMYDWCCKFIIQNSFTMADGKSRDPITGYERKDFDTNLFPLNNNQKVYVHHKKCFSPSFPFPSIKNLNQGWFDCKFPSSSLQIFV